MSTRLDTSLAHARALDAADPLAKFRAQFALPRSPHQSDTVYLAGHSLGLAPLAARALVDEALEDWARLGVLGHEQAARPWIPYAESLRADLAALCGALPEEVVAMNSLSVNLHLMLASFYRPVGARRRILVEAGAFPSDRHVIASQISWHGLTSTDCLIELAPRAGEDTLRPEDIVTAIERAGNSLALVLWPGVQYLTGQAFDLQPISHAAHRVGALAGFDLAHAIGNLPLNLHDQAADFAVWCGYKYLNGGPGAIGGAFVHERHCADRSRPRLSGWWSHEAATRFQMSAQLQRAAGAAGWAISNPPIFSSAPLIASLALFRAAGMSPLRAKSLALTGYLEALLAARCPAVLQLVSPADPAQRGAQLSLRLTGGRSRARALFEALAPHGVVADWREPDIVRAAPAPLYVRFEDVWRFVDVLGAQIA